MPRAVHRHNSRGTPHSAESPNGMAPPDVDAEVARRLRENPDWFDTEFWADTACPSGCLPSDLAEWNAADKAGVAAHAAHAAGWDVFWRDQYPLDLLSSTGWWLAEHPASSRVVYVRIAGQEALGASPRRAKRRAMKHSSRTPRAHEPDFVVTITRSS